MLDSRTLTESYSAYNVFALGLKYLITHGHLSVAQLPKAFIAAAASEKPEWADRHKLYHWMYAQPDLSTYQLYIATYLRACFENEPSSRGGAAEVHYLAELFGIQVNLTSNDATTLLGVAHQTHQFDIACQGGHWQFMSEGLPELPRLKRLPRKVATNPSLKHEHKRHDIQCLLSMQQLMAKRNEISCRDLLMQVSAFCGGEEGIHFNDGDEAIEYVRNRYGMRVRSDGYKLNPDKNVRIDFEMLYRLKAILKRGAELPDGLQKELLILYFKLNNIIAREKAADSLLFANIKLNETVIATEQAMDDLTRLDDFVRRHYPNILLQSIQEESEKLSRIVSVDKPNIYKFARRILVIGELLHEYGDLFPDAKKVKKRNLFSLFNLLNDLRNRFVHFDLHRTILFLHNADEPKLEQTMLAICQALFQLFTAVDSIQDDIEDKDVDLYKQTKEHIIQFMSLVSWNQKLKLHKRATRLVVSAHRLYTLIDSPEYRQLCDFARRNYHMTPQLERALQDTSPSYLLMLLSGGKKGLKDLLSAEQQAELARHMSAVKVSIARFQLTELKAEVAEFLQQDDIQAYIIEKFGVAQLPGLDLDKLQFQDPNTTTMLHDVVKRLQQDPDFKINKTTAKKLYSFINVKKGKLNLEPRFGGSMANLARDFAKVKAAFAELKEEDKLALEEEFDFSLTDEAERDKVKALAEQQATQESLNNPTAKYAKKINRELQYMVEVQASTEPDKDSIIEHIVTLVGQYIRDIEFNGTHDNILLSQTAKMAAFQAKTARSKGLAHEVCHFDKSSFERKLMRHILPSQQDFHAAEVVNAGQGVDKTSLIYDEVGDAYTRLGWHELAVQQYLTALKYSFIEDPHDPFNENSVNHKSILTKMGITTPTGVLIDTYKILFNMSIFELATLAKVMRAYNLLNDTVEVLRLFDLFNDRIDLDAVMEYKKMLGHAYSREKGPVQFTKPALDGAQINLDEFPLYSKKMHALIKKIKKIQRPYVFLEDDQGFMLACADVLGEFGKACMLHEEYTDAAYRLSMAFDLVTGQVEFYSDANVFHIASYNETSTAKHQLQLAWCHYYMNQPQITAEMIKLPLKTDDLAIRLEAHCLWYWVLRQNNGDFAKQFRVCKGVFNRHIEAIKHLLGDQVIGLLEKFHAVKCDFLISRQNFSGLKLYLQRSAADVLQEFGYELHTAYSGLHLSLAQSYASLLDPQLDDESYFKLLQRALYHFQQARQSPYRKDETIAHATPAFKNQIKTYISHYIDGQNKKDFVRLAKMILEQANDTVFVEVAMEFLQQAIPLHRDNPRELIELAEQFYHKATELQAAHPKIALAYAFATFTMICTFDQYVLFANCCEFMVTLMLSTQRYTKAIVTLEHAKVACYNACLPQRFNMLDEKIKQARQDLYQKAYDDYQSARIDSEATRWLEAIKKLNNTLKEIAHYEHDMSQILKRNISANFNGLAGDICYQLAVVHRELGNAEQATKHAERAMSFYQRHPNLYEERSQNTARLLIDISDAESLNSPPRLDGIK